MHYSLFLFLLFISFSSYSFEHSHAEYDRLLSTIVTENGAETTVDYDYLKNNPETLNSYLATLESVSKQDFDSWNKSQQLAFLINTYNAFTLKLIINNYPGIDSIRDLGGLIFSSPWDRKFFNLFGKKTSLGYIEHDVLREKYNEPRIHFAINCASKSCPALQKRAYIADKLDEQLENATIQFMRNNKYNRFDPDNKRLEISSIFTWFTADFTKNGSLQNFIAPYISDDPKIQSLLKDDKNSKNSSSGIGSSLKQNEIKIIFLDYDWSLNKL
ncbi:MAG: DUF547 domain-containing protein [Proteobacteria bacterium]|nr:DUF547 domain-containing protein [Pseudomonadota bacterium]NOG59248.1 DUF547 domain-containing protein [Pseudomonadota bacterium]